ncbi:MAG: hypothetical protein DRN81_07455, partial [Thermoproteota archaeon]
VGGVIDVVPGVLGGAIDAVTGAASGAIDAVTGVVGGVIDAVPTVTQKAVTFLHNHITAPLKRWWAERGEKNSEQEESITQFNKIKQEIDNAKINVAFAENNVTFYRNEALKYWHFEEENGKITFIPNGYEAIMKKKEELEGKLRTKEVELDRYFTRTSGEKGDILFYKLGVNKKKADNVFNEYKKLYGEYAEFINKYFEEKEDSNGKVSLVYKVSPEAEKALENYFDALDAYNQARSKYNQVISKYFDTQKIKVNFGKGQVKEISYVHLQNTEGIIGVEENKVYTAEKIKDNAYILKEGEKPIILFVVKEGAIVSYHHLPSSGAYILKEENGIKIINNKSGDYTQIVIKENGELEIYNYKATGYRMYPDGMYPGKFTVSPDNINMRDDIDSLPGIVDIEFASHPRYFSSDYTPVGILEFNTEDRKGPDNIKFISTGFSEEKGWLGGVIEKIKEGWNHMIFALDADSGSISLTATNTDKGVIYSIQKKKDSKAPISDEDAKVKTGYGIYDIPYIDDYFHIGKVLVEMNPLIPVTPGKMMVSRSDLSPEEKLFHFLTPNSVDYYLRVEAWKNYAYEKNKAEGISLDEDKLYALEEGMSLENLDKNTVNGLLQMREEGKYMYFPEAYTIGDAVCDGTLIVVTAATLGSGTPEAATTRTGITGVDIAAESAARTGTRVALEGLTETGVRTGITGV